MAHRLLGITVFIAFVVLTACTIQPVGSKGSVPLLGTEEIKSPTALPLAENEVVQFVGGLPLAIVSVDPHNAIDDSGNRISLLVFEGMVAMGADGTWQGVLAESWEVSVDGLTWTFHLRQGVMFHNGREMMAEDVVYSLDRILNEANGATMYSVLSGKVDSVAATGPYTVQFILNGGSGTFLSELGLDARVAIVAKECVNEDGSITQPIGTGPFKFVSWEPGVAWRAERFDQYWGQVAQIDQVKFVPLKDDTARLVALETGEADWILSVPFDKIAVLQGNDDLVIRLIYQNNTVRLNFNSTRPPFDDPRVRQAVSYAIDKNEINEAMYFGMGIVHNQPFSAGSFMHLDVEDVYAVPNVEKAKELLTEAGYPNGLEITVIHPAGFLPGFWELIASQLNRVGVTLNLELMDIPQLIERAQALDYDMMGDQQSHIFHWDRTFSYFVNTSSSNFWVGGYHNDALAPMLEAGRNESDPAKAKVIYTKILRILQDDAAALFVLALPDVQAWRSSLGGFTPNPMNGALVWPGGGLNYTWIE